MNRLERKRVQEKRRRSEFQEALDNLQSCLLEHDQDFSREAQKREARSAQRQSNNLAARSDQEVASLQLHALATSTSNATSNNAAFKDADTTGADSFKIFNRVEILNQAVFTVNSIVQERLQLLKAIEALRHHRQHGTHHPLPEATETIESCHERVAFHEGVGPVFLRDAMTGSGTRTGIGVAAAKEPHARNTQSPHINVGAAVQNIIQSQNNQSSNTMHTRPNPSTSTTASHAGIVSSSSSSSLHHLAPILGAARLGQTTRMQANSIVPTESPGDNSTFPYSWQEHQQNILILLASKRRELEQVQQVQNQAILRHHQQLLAPVYQQALSVQAAARNLLVTPPSSGVLTMGANSQYLPQLQSVPVHLVADSCSQPPTFITQHTTTTTMEHPRPSFGAPTPTPVTQGFPILESLLAEQIRESMHQQHAGGRDAMMASTTSVLGTNISEPHAPTTKRTKKRHKKNEESL